MCQHLAFVVGGAAGPDPAIADLRIERIVGPEAEWIDGLDVVVSVNEYVAPAGLMWVAGEDNGMFRGFVELAGEAHGGEFRAQPFGAGAHFAAVARIGGNTGETQEGEEVFKLRSHGAMLAAGTRVPQGEFLGTRRW